MKLSDMMGQDSSKSVLSKKDTVNGDEATQDQDILIDSEMGPTDQETANDVASLTPIATQVETQSTLVSQVETQRETPSQETEV